MNKICTSIEQSKKLLELGIDVNTADMYYPNRTDMRFKGAIPIEMKLGNPLLSQEIPTWSLSALLKIINRNIFIEIYKEIIGDWHLSAGVLDVYNNDLIDACYEMILKLKENKL